MILILKLYYSDKADVLLHFNMYLQRFLTDNKLLYKHTVQTVFRTDTMEEHTITWQQVLSDHDHGYDLWPPFCLFTKMAVVCLETERPSWRLCSWMAALFPHQWSSSWTRFRDKAHLQYKNIVQQFSCHSKHSYLSFNDPVTSAATQKKKTEKNPHSATQSLKFRQLKL